MVKGKVVLVTGATSGIGESIAEYLSSQGAAVVLVGRNTEKLNAMVENLGENTYGYTYDLLELEHVEDIFKFCRNKGLKLDGLVHCAGIVDNGAVKSNDIAKMQEIMTINCFSFFELGKFFSLKKYSNEGASLLAISSTASLRNDKGLSQYAASKAALNSSVVVMSKEFERRKIRVNAILPANVVTPMFKSVEDQVEGFEEKAERMQPLGLIEPLYIAYFAEFLLSERAKYITGSLMPITGGLGY